MDFNSILIGSENAPALVEYYTKVLGAPAFSDGTYTAWQIGSGFPALSAHVLVAPREDCHGVRGELERLLEAEFGIEHTTLQVDHAREPQFVKTIGTSG